MGDPAMVTWNELVDEARADFEASDIPESDASARWIARQATGSDAAEWLELADQPATKRQVAAFDRMVERRRRGEPLQYVLGSWGFRSLDLFIDHRVLIPRPETEVVAGVAIAETARILDPDPGDPAAARPAPAPPADTRQANTPQTNAIVVDLGTGSGAIGLSVALERPGTEVWLTDVSAKALQVARANLAGIGRAGGGVRLAEGSWFGALPAELETRVAVVVSNPPYVASVADLEPQVADWEPTSALVAAEGGTAHLVELIDRSPPWLRTDGALVLEMAPDQVTPMMERAALEFSVVEPIVDLAERPRGLVARFPRR